ncbi:bis(5'-nucleosyl)-tetraphosphatase (symmetrical) YqeK [Acholeplasma hippikon]|uniref:bis(5'-nucleosyl)-tetraphosphatase (symmetrical) n=1 Tax=Acholeplasma hippikon TaxID=264636 RepID=A0A449BJH7_9MOLU|nr:bis(5'-nucleosyl)-tetraphosphatase (symmetrical) YqeK [Acholeplasma hippikon]VEU82588.1 putative nicotinate-nucleotide adenylyltransferase [Acholeplasma hippikon]
MIDKIYLDVKEKYKDRYDRFLHILGVRDTAVMLAKRYHVDEKRAEIAALFHDYTKYDDKAYQMSFLTQEELKKYEGFEVMYHAISASRLLEQKYEIHDPEILSAIYNHVWGKPKMSLLDKIILIADKTEPSRNFLLVDELRKLSFESLDLAIIKYLEDYKLHVKNEGYNYPLEVDSIIQELKGV